MLFLLFVLCLTLHNVFFLTNFFFFKQKTAYEMRISDWSSDVCSSDLIRTAHRAIPPRRAQHLLRQGRARHRRRAHQDRKSVVKGKSVSVRVDLGGRRIIKKKIISVTLYQ